MDAGLTLPRVRTREDSKETLKRSKETLKCLGIRKCLSALPPVGVWGFLGHLMLSRLFVCAGGSGAMAQLRERFGAAGRAGGEGFAQTAREKENKANFSFIPFKKKQKRSPLALHKLKRRLNPCLERTLAPRSYILIFITLSKETNEFEAWIYPWPCSHIPAGRGSWCIIFTGSDLLLILPVLVGGPGCCKGSL